MNRKFQNLAVNLLSNLISLILLFLVVQNSREKSAIKLYFWKSVDTPIGLILGLGFFSGSTFGYSLKAINKD
tara:strand:- start:523 stop:738 length:216 start_codon:yes stop_codon:yes gene_type:complete